MTIPLAIYIRQSELNDAFSLSPSHLTFFITYPLQNNR